MTPEEFVAALQKTVLAAAVEATVATLKHPPGRRPREELVEASGWFRALSDEDQATLLRVLDMTAHHAIFGFLAVLDGARVVEDDAEKGEFRLTFRKSGQEWTIIDSKGAPLHDILNRSSVDKST